MALRKSLYYLVFVTVLLFLSACSSMYIPAMPSLPLLEKKGDAQIEFSASTNSIRLSGNYAFSKKIALMVDGNLSYKNFTNYYDIFTKEDHVKSSGWFTSDYGEFAHKYAELGIGWYNILKKPGSFHNKLKLEVFGGIGYGIAKDQKNEPFPLQYEANYYTGFIQANMGIAFNEKFTLGWGLRLANSYYDYSYQTVQIDHYPDHEIFTHLISFSLLHIEPMVMFRAGKHALKFIGQVGPSLTYTLQSLDRLINPEVGIDDGYVNKTGFHLSVGIHYTFGNRKNKKVTGK